MEKMDIFHILYHGIVISVDSFLIKFSVNLYIVFLNKTNSQVSPKKMSKRDNYLSWEDYFMGIATLSAQRSKDPNTQVGTCIVDSRNRIVGIFHFKIRFLYNLGMG